MAQCNGLKKSPFKGTSRSRVPRDLKIPWDPRQLHFYKNPFAVKEPDGQETEGGEGNGVGESGPTWAGDVRDRMRTDPHQYVHVLSVGGDGNVVEHTRQQLAEHIGCDGIGAKHKPWKHPSIAFALAPALLFY